MIAIDTCWVFQCVFPIVNEDRTMRELIAEAQEPVRVMAAEAGTRVMGAADWAVQEGPETPGWETWSGLLLVGQVPIEPIDLFDNLHCTCAIEEEVDETPYQRNIRRQYERTELDAKVLELWKQDKNDVEIGEVLDMPNDVIYRSRRRQNLDNVVMRSRREIDDQVRSLWEQGKADSEIARSIGRSTTVVFDSRHRMGLPANMQPQVRQRLAFDAQVKELWEKRLSDAEISAATGKSRSAVGSSRTRQSLPSHYMRKPRRRRGGA